MTEGLAGLGRGARVFYRKDASTWQQGELVSLSDGKAAIQVGGQSLTVASDLVVAANPVLQDGIPDVVQLSYLNEPGILYNLEHRFAGATASIARLGLELFATTCATLGVLGVHILFLSAGGAFAGVVRGRDKLLRGGLEVRATEGHASHGLFMGQSMRRSCRDGFIIAGSG